MPPTLAVCITYYNEGRLLTECLRSLYANTRSPDEVLVYDDASRDPAESYLQDFPQVRLIRNEINRGPGYARDCMIAASICDYIHLHDSDDIFLPSWCMEIFRVIEAAHPDIVITDVDRVSEVDGHIPRQFQLSKLHPTDSTPLYKVMLESDIFPAVVTFRRPVALEIGGHRWREVINMGEDTDFFMRLALQTNNFICIDQKLIRKPERAQSYSQLYDSQSFEKLYAESGLKLRLLLMPILPPEEQKSVASWLLAFLTTPTVVNPILVEKASEYLFSWARGQKITVSNWLPFRILLVRFLGVRATIRLAHGYQKFLPVNVRRALAKQGLE
jgi:glycosyltransferase involved in cell wall biosynthesis